MTTVTVNNTVHTVEVVGTGKTVVVNNPVVNVVSAGVQGPPGPGLPAGTTDGNLLVWDVTLGIWQLHPSVTITDAGIITASPQLNLNGVVLVDSAASALTPTVANTYDLGTSALPWKDVVNTGTHISLGKFTSKQFGPNNIFEFKNDTGPLGSGFIFAFYNDTVPVIRADYEGRLYCDGVSSAGSVTGTSFNGVILTTAGSSTQYLSGDGTYSTVPINIVQDLTPQLGGNLDAQSFAIQNIDQLRSDVVDGATAIAFEFNTLNSLVNADAKLLSLKNNTTEKFYVGEDGGFRANGSCAINTAPADTKGLNVGKSLNTTEASVAIGVEVSTQLNGAAATGRGTVYSMQYVSFMLQTGAVDTGSVIGFYGITLAGGGPNRVGSAYGGLFGINCFGNDVKTGYGMYIAQPIYQTGTVDELAGIYVASQIGISGGASSKGISVEKRELATLNIGIELAGDGIGADIMFGAGNDANIYYDGTDLIINPKVVGTGAVKVQGDINCNSNSIDNAKSITFVAEVANTGLTQTIDWTAGQKQNTTITAATTVSFTAPAGPANLTLKVVNGGLGAITWPATVKWASGSEPSWSSAGTDIAAFYYDGTNYYGAANTAFA